MHSALLVLWRENERGARMRLIDADAMIGRICGKNCGAKPIQCEEPCIEVRDILAEPTNTIESTWIKTQDRLPELPEKDFCYVLVNTSNGDGSRSTSMFYERTIIRGKRAERWRSVVGNISPAPAYWREIPAFAIKEAKTE